MFGIGETELLIIVVFAFMVFGPDKLPGMGRTIGRALRQFREAQESFTQVVQAEVVDPLNSAMNEPSAKRRAQAAAEAAAEDADLDTGEIVPKKRETFAERKARLQAEQAAVSVSRDREPAEGGEADIVFRAAGTASPHDESLPGKASDKAAGEGESPSNISAAALYAMGPQRRTVLSGADDASATLANGDEPLVATPVRTAYDGKEAGGAD